MNAQIPQAMLPPLEKLIRPDQVQNILCLSPEKRVQYHEGITALWKKIQDHPQLDNPERIGAHKRLADVSNVLKLQMQKWRQENGQNAAANNPRPMGQPGAGPAPGFNGASYRPQPQGPPAEAYSENVKAQVRALALAIPPQVAAMSLEDRQAWAQNEKRKYAILLKRYEEANTQMAELQNVVAARRQQGREFNAEERQTLTTRQAQYRQVLNDTKDQISQFRKAQDHYRDQQQLLAQGGGPSTQPLARPNAPTQTPSQTQGISSGAPNTAQTATESPSISLPPNPTLEATRNQTSQAEQPHNSMSPSVTSTQTQIPTSQPHTSQPQPTSAAGVPASQPTVTAHSQPHQSPQPNPAQLPNSGQAYPLSHKAAVAHAQRSYSQPNGSQSATQAHAHPNIPNETTPANTKYPITKQLQVTPLAPVQMGPARPTLSGGPSTGAMGSMGQPGIQKHPGYVLEGEGERVLSKKKLEELVRQVTGGSDGEGAEVLDPDVEEVSPLQTRIICRYSRNWLLTHRQTLLDVADEFVDNVIIAACRLAKLRQSATLELRDIQLILERNYNIRVPGFASDELRTVKKIQPTQAWSQKVAAVMGSRLTKET